MPGGSSFLAARGGEIRETPKGVARRPRSWIFLLKTRLKIVTLLRFQYNVFRSSVDFFG
jgi:hypothetical protein